MTHAEKLNRLAASAGWMNRLVRILREKYRRWRMRPAIRRLGEMAAESIADIELENDPEIRKLLINEMTTCHDAASWLLSDVHPKIKAEALIRIQQIELRKLNEYNGLLAQENFELWAELARLNSPLAAAREARMAEELESAMQKDRDPNPAR